jgi:hypothetical protein
MTRAFAGKSAPALLALALAAGRLPAQEMWLGPRDGASIAVEAMQVNFTWSGMVNLGSGGVKQDFGSTALFLTGRAPVWSGTALVMELPVSYGSFTADNGLGYRETISDFGIGNPYVGVEGGQRGSPVFGELGVRLPVMSERKVASALVGLFSDLDRMDAFLPDIVTVSAFMNVRAGGNAGFRFRLRAGPMAWFATKSFVLEHPELYGAYAVQAGYAFRLVEVFGGVTGRAILTESVENRFTDQAVLAVHLNLGRVEPGLSLRVPLDNGRNDLISSTVGVSVRVAM